MAKLYKKEIRAVACGGCWQGFNPTVTPLSDWVDEDLEDDLREEWTDEKVKEAAHDNMVYLDFETRLVEVL